MRRAFEQFNTTSTLEWFEKRGVLMDTLSDNCIFPKSNSSQTIIDCFENEAKRKGVSTLISTSINLIQLLENHLDVTSQVIEIS